MSIVFVSESRRCISRGRNSLLCIRKRKTSNNNIKLTGEAEQILGCYSAKKRAGGYVFPIFSNKSEVGK